jgi:hypothetical protein
MKDTESRPLPDQHAQPTDESLREDHEHLLHQYDDIDREFYTEGAGDA